MQTVLKTRPRWPTRFRRPDALDAVPLAATRGTGPPNEQDLTEIFLHGRSVHTQRSYARALSEFRAFLRRPLAEARLADIQRWDDALAAHGLSASTRRQRLAVLRSWYDSGLRLGVLVGDPTLALRSPPVRDTLANRILTLAQVQALLAVARGRIVKVPLRPKWLSLADVAALLRLRLSTLRHYARRRGWIRKGRSIQTETTWCTYRYYNREDIERFVCQGRAFRDYALLIFLYESGCRISEALGLKWQDLSIQKDGDAAVTVFGKGGRTRTVGLRRECVALLTRLRGAAAPGGYVFRAMKPRSDFEASERPYMREHTCRFLHRLAKEAGLGLAVSAHWFRHAHASHSLDNGCPIHILKLQLGHASLTSTEKYLHARPGVTSATFLPSIRGPA